MFYKLLGMVVWKAGKSLLRYKYGSTPKPLFVGGALLAIAGVALAARRRGGDE